MLWLDDNNEFVDRASRLLEPHGFDVDKAYNLAMAEKCLATGQYSHILADYNLGGGKTGLEFLAGIADETTDDQPALLLVSSCFGSSLASDSIPPGIDPVPINPAWFREDEVFVSEVVDILRNGVDLLTMRFDAYESLTLEAREEQIDRVLEQQADTFDELFGDEVVWYAICGRLKDGKPRVINQASAWDEVITDDELWELGRKYGYAPIQVFADAEVEDCASARDLQSYPTISFRLPENDEEHAVHFDSGTFDLWLDADRWSDLGVVPKMKAPGGGRLRRRRLPDGSGPTDSKPTRVRQTSFDTQLLLRCQVSGETRLQKLRVRAVRGWSSTELVTGRRCDEQGCSVQSDVDGLCINRRGLFGRALLLQTRVELVLVPKDNQIVTALRFDSPSGEAEVASGG